MSSTVEPTGSPEPILTRSTDSPVPRRLRALGRVRIPIAGAHAPWATLYRFPDGRLLWSVRLWEMDRAVPHLVTTDVLRTFARRHRLVDLEGALDTIVRRARNDVA